VPGEDDPVIFTLRTPQDMDRIIAVAKPGLRAVVAGGGYLGLEMVEQLHRKGFKVTLVQRHPHVLSQFDSQVVMPLHDELRAHGIESRFTNQLASINRNDAFLECVLATGETLEADMVVLSIGVHPDSDLAQKAGLALSASGHIVVNEFMQTSDPDIYAAGDAVQTRDRVFGNQLAVALAGPANRQGRVAADHIFLGELARPYPGSIGTSIVRLFGMMAAGTGWTEWALSKDSRNYNTVTVHGHHHAAYYPGAELMTLKLIWDPETGVVLGAQAVGKEGVDKRIDVLATAIIGRMTIDDLCHLELTYAPPFGVVRDIVNLAGFAATNVRDGLVRMSHYIPDDPAIQVLDVRSKSLADSDPLPGAIRIPYQQLRKSLGMLDKNKPVLAVCQLGRTSYFAVRILLQNGFQAISLSGGVKGLGGAAKKGVFVTPCSPRSFSI
ncbi:MAG: FAD-dependent oxidoreductase, partial [Burkholderiaceae bacterium]|jgi:NADPH-dependent 2,4-dienoyl-CoA reductase/sulfur reductase-like enzyme/rhodanese-related sulfurtransferase|nr:FAD-dependent oxidoreductase [Burkholderiaceae bacterium]